jgi:TDG/mug DNA glycosylase family protein
MLPDRLAPALEVVFCGTAAGNASAQRGHYYAGRGNRFWQLLAETGLTPHLFAPEEDHRLLQLGIGLTDLAKGVSGMDKDIPPAAYTPKALEALIDRYAPRRIAFTSLTAARIALGERHGSGKLAQSPLSGAEVWVLPSPSGAARGSFSADPWHDLARDIRASAKAGSRQ